MLGESGLLLHLVGAVLKQRSRLAPSHHICPWSQTTVGGKHAHLDGWSMTKGTLKDTVRTLALPKRWRSLKNEGGSLCPCTENLLFGRSSRIFGQNF